MAIAASVATAAVVALPFVRFAYQEPVLHVVLETANALIALVVAYLVYGRFRQRRRMQDLLLVLALGSVAIANLALSALPSAVTIDSGEELSRWAALTIRLVGTALFAAAALTTARWEADRRRAVSLVTLLGGLVVVVVAIGLLFGEHLPPTVDPSAVLGDASQPRLVAHPLVLAAQGAGAALYGVAAIAFSRRSDRRRDEFFRWVAAACVLAAASRVHYLLFPSLYSDYVYTGDLLRLGFYLLLLVGAGREIRSYWALRTRAAVLEDRRRMARDLHDGLAQELSYLWSQTRSLTGTVPDPRTVERIGDAAARALDEARRAIAALTRPVDEPFPRTLEKVADDLGSRYDVKVCTDLDPAADVGAQQGETLVRIVSEAVRNAVRHGAATRIDIALTAEPLRITVTDDGRGFSPATAKAGRREGGGFGLTSMQERAQGLGGELTIDSTPGAGTTVQVTLR